MNNQNESMQDYVIRKLNDPMFNIVGVSKATSISRVTLYSIMKGTDVSYTKISRLHDFFKKLGD